MTRKQIEAARETRLWITHVIMPVVTATLILIPEARTAVVDKVKETKETISNKLRRK